MTNNEYLARLFKINNKYKEMYYGACQFGYDANYLADLINSGKKKATSSLCKLYDVSNEPEPIVGNITMVLDHNDKFICFIENIKIIKIAFKDVGSDIAKLEGEGDCSLAYW